MVLKCWKWSCSSVRISYPDTSTFSKLNVMDMNWGLTWILYQCQSESCLSQCQSESSTTRMLKLTWLKTLCSIWTRNYGKQPTDWAYKLWKVSLPFDKQEFFCRLIGDWVGASSWLQYSFRLLLPLFICKQLIWFISYELTYLRFFLM